jgi:hypothetical protein
MSGEMRRPPQLWEQRLARTTSILGAGISSSGDATAIVPPSSPPGAGGGTEPAPVAPAPGLFIAPSAPTLIGSVQGINVVWNGLNSAGDLWPSDTSFVEVHMSTAGTGFTPDASTLKGRLVRPGGLAVVGLTSGVTYHFRLRGADPAGNYTSAGAAASGTPGLITAPDIAANAITANSIVAGTITGWSINSAYLSGGTVSGGYITGGTVDGALIRSAASGQRVEIQSSQVSLIDSGGTSRGAIYADSTNGMLVGGGSKLYLWGDTVYLGPTLGPFVSVTSGAIAGSSLDVSGALESATLDVSGSGVDMPGVYSNNTTGLDSVGITTAGRLRRLSSSQDIKYDITPLSGALSASVEPDRVSDVATVNPSAILDVAVTEFSIIDNGEPTDRRVLGFIADDVADKLPIAVTRDEDGRPAGVLDTSLLAAVLAVVQDQAATIEDLRARIEALEA